MFYQYANNKDSVNFFKFNFLILNDSFDKTLFNINNSRLADFISFSEQISEFNNVYPKSMDVNSKKNLLLALQSVYMDIERAVKINS